MKNHMVVKLYVYPPIILNLTTWQIKCFTFSNVSLPEHFEETDEASSDSSSEDELFQPLSSTPRNKKDTITLTLPRKGLFKETADLSARLHLSHRQGVAFTAKLIKMGGGNLGDVTLSTSSAHRERSRAYDERTMDIMKEFKLNMPQYVVMHWDGKVIEYESGDIDDRLCIKVKIIIE